MIDDPIKALIIRIADALDRMAPKKAAQVDLEAGDAFIWNPELCELTVVSKVNRIDIKLLQGIDLQKEKLIENTQRFAKGLPANNALLWGAKGTGKSSIVKSVHWHIVKSSPGSLKLIEIHREDIPTLPTLLALLKDKQKPCIIFCDDLSFEEEDTAYKSLKAVLDGGLEGRPDTVLFYATSNRRHLMPRDMIENEKSTAISPTETIDEKVSLSDRFGLWLGFHNCDQATWLDMIAGYVDALNIPVAEEEWRPLAIEWTVTRGARSGRVAWQFIQDLAARYETKITLD